MNTSADMSKFLSKVLRCNTCNADRMQVLLDKYTKSNEEGRFDLFAAVAKELILGRDIERARKAALIREIKNPSAQQKGGA